MKQKPWDRYEAALLLSYCLKIEAAGYEFVKGKTGDLSLSLLDKNASP